MTRRKPETKVDLPLDKAAWQPSLLLGQIVLISSRSSQGEAHAARKSWVSMVASDPPMAGVCCRLSHRTAINILETREFVINVPGEDLMARVWAAGDGVGALVGPVESQGWTFLPSTRVSAPRVQECRGHIECSLESMKRLNQEELIFFGRIVGASMDESLLKGTPEDRYRALRAVIYLESGLYGVVDSARKPPP